MNVNILLFPNNWGVLGFTKVPDDGSLEIARAAALQGLVIYDLQM